VIWVPCLSFYAFFLFLDTDNNKNAAEMQQNKTPITLFSLIEENQHNQFLWSKNAWQ
jgi:hypothetical protein